jgi:hypothetical protein
MNRQLSNISFNDKQILNISKTKIISDNDSIRESLKFKNIINQNNYLKIINNESINFIAPRKIYNESNYIQNEELRNDNIKLKENVKFLLNQIKKYQKMGFSIETDNESNLVQELREEIVLLRQYITIYTDNLAGVLLLGTGFVSPCATSLGLRLISIWACFKGWKHKSNFIRGIISGPEIKKWDTIGKDLNRSWLTRDPEMAKKLIFDKKSHFVFTLNGYYGLLQCINYVCNNSNIVKVKSNLPILFLSGKCDLVGNYGKVVIKSAEIMRNMGSIDVTLKLIDNDRHELLNEIDRKDIYIYILNWIEQKSKIYENKKLNNII